MPLLTLSEESALFPAPHGASVRETRLGTPGFETAPDEVFLIYLRVDRDSGLHVSHYRDKLDGRSIADAEAALMAEARPRYRNPDDRYGEGKPHRVGSNFEGLDFSTPCYFTIILDEARWRFYDDPAAPMNDPIVFLAEKHGQIFDPNDSFFDATIITPKGRPGLRCINFVRADAAGTPIPEGQSRRFCFEIHLSAPFSLPGSQRHITIIIDPTGENQGPRPPGQN
jgi:hypothetical protein